MPASLAFPQDVADVWRPLTPDEELRVASLISKASVLLRQKCPWVDARVVTYTANPTNPAGLDPALVALVVATSVKRFLSNQAGIASEGVGGYSIAYALKTDKGFRGEIEILKEDIDKLTVSSLTVARLQTIRVKPKLAPYPDGSLTSATDETALDVYVPDGSTDGNYMWGTGV